MSTATRQMTAEELIRLPRGRRRYELVKGELVDPQTRTVAVHQLHQAVRLLTEGDELTGDDVVPDFSFPVSEIFF